MVGLGKQEEGEIIVGPSGQALEPPDSGNTPFLFLSGNLFIQLKHLLIRSSSQIPFVHLELSHSQMNHPKRMKNLRLPPKSKMRLIGHAPG